MSSSTEVDVSVPVKKGGKKSFLAAEVPVVPVADEKVPVVAEKVPVVAEKVPVVGDSCPPVLTHDPSLADEVKTVASVAGVPVVAEKVPVVAVVPEKVASVADVPVVAVVPEKVASVADVPVVAEKVPVVAVVPEKVASVADVPVIPEKVPVVAVVPEKVASVADVPEIAVVVPVIPVAPVVVEKVASVADVPVVPDVPVEPAAGVGNSVVLGEISATIHDIASDASVSDKLLQVILDATLKKPGTGMEAVALAEFVYKKDIIPLIEKLRGWAVEELKEKDVSIAQKAWGEMQAIEKQVSGWCCLPSKKK
jgi:hypothetical protein